MKSTRLSTAAIAATIIFGTVALDSCTAKSSYDDKTISFATLSHGSTYRLSGSADVFETDSDLVFVDSVSMIMPTLIGNLDLSQLQDSIMQAAFDSTGVDHLAIIDAYFKKVNTESGFTPEESHEHSDILEADGFEYVSGAVVNLSPRLLVYCITSESMIPHAAHGMTIKRYINYLVEDGSVLTLDKLFTSDGLSKLPETIARRAEEKAILFGPTDINALPDRSNFYLSSTGEIVFVYQPYEVASYAQGFINVAFYPYELVEYMTPDAVNLFGLTDLVR